jgi:hypothetical protein
MRTIVLQKFYDLRNSGDVIQLGDIIDVAPNDEIQVANVCEQLGQHGLIEWNSIKSLAGVVGGIGKITARGVDVIEGSVEPPLAMIFHDHSISVTGSSNVQLGIGNVQGLDIDVGKLMLAIDHSSASEAEKKEAKSLLQKVMSNKILWGILGAILHSASAQ